MISQYVLLSSQPVALRGPMMKQAVKLLRSFAACMDSVLVMPHSTHGHGDVTTQ